MLWLLVLLLGLGFRLSEAIDWNQPIYQGDSLPGIAKSLGRRTSNEAELQRRGTNKTVWISAKVYQGATFFDEWDFYDGADFTHGLVDYLNRSEAVRTGLAYITPEGRANMRVDNTTTLLLEEVNSGTRFRPSVRISTKATYTHGLFILDVAQAPYGCGVRPAYLGTRKMGWPVGGEIDIIENVHNSQSNQVSWHTTANCTLTSPGNFTGTVDSTICDHAYNSNQGCNIMDPSIASFGATFNGKGGGVFVMKWDSDSIDVWFFHRSAIPDDILSGQPDPSIWQTPSASLSKQGCPIDSHFWDHALTFDTTLCGDLAGPTYESSGCPGTCNETVTNPANFVNATWSINYIKIYNETVINTAYLDAGASPSTWGFPVFILVFSLLTGLTIV